MSRTRTNRSWMDRLASKRRHRLGTSSRPTSTDRHRFRPLADPLEDRTLLSTIRWVNRGDDNFASVFGTQTALARNVVDAAIADWQRTIEDFNYLIGNTFDLYVSMREDGTG